MVNDADKLNALLHYMKGVERFSQIYQYYIRGAGKWCPFTHPGRKLNLDCYNAHPGTQAVLAWTRKYAQCAKFLDAHRYTVDQISSVIAQIEAPKTMDGYEDYRRLLNELGTAIGFIEPDITRKLQRISCEECSRLDEALVCYSNYAFIGSVAMAVSAVEARIVQIIRKKNDRLYKSQFSRSTLGQLIQIFDEDQYKGAKYVPIKKLLPSKHRPLLLLLLLNQYRIFSVHPRGEEVTAQAAESILHLAFSFMADDKTCPYTSKELKHKTSESKKG